MQHIYASNALTHPDTGKQENIAHYIHDVVHKNRRCSHVYESTCMTNKDRVVCVIIEIATEIHLLSIVLFRFVCSIVVELSISVST
jgi:hypothetical protein